MKFCLILLYEKYSNIFFVYAILDLTGQPSHGDFVGGSDAQTPQHPSTSHILMRLFASPFVAQRTKTSRAHETPPPHSLDRACEGLQGESHEDIGSAQPEHYYLGAHVFKSQEHSPSAIWWTKTWFP
jgi:hypothetical protein